jgi:DNA phosphorothioation-associated putative methyltransferase
MSAGISSLERAGATAMKRVELSRPVRLALETGVIRPADGVFDYGCGHGQDIKFLRELGHDATGWDPNHRPAGVRQRTPIINLGYVLNVIEDPTERASALKEAWALTERAIVVAVRTVDETRFVSSATDHVDGVLTGADTFQKFFRQAEARSYIDEITGSQSIPLGPGVFVAFKSEGAEQEWLENRAALQRRVRRLRRIIEPRKTLRDEAYETHREILRPLEEFIAERGRLPVDGEHEWVGPIAAAFGSVPRAFQVIRHVADRPWWDDAADDRRQELLVRFALARLRRRPKLSALPPGVQRDVRSLFGSYKSACTRADYLLFSIGNPETIKEAANVAPVGKRTPEAHYVHVDALDLLPTQLRVFIGAADTLIGRVPEATLVKAHIDKPRVSYLVYPDFDTDPHPALAESWVVDFLNLDVRPHDYRQRNSPPILHRKELFVSPDHPRRQTFTRLSQQEERHGLLTESSSIGTRASWNALLEERGWSCRGHRLVRTANARNALSQQHGPAT